MMLLSERRKRKRIKASEREIKNFIGEPEIPATPSHDIFLQNRSEYVFIERRLGISTQHPERNSSEITRLEKARDAVLRDTPNVTDGLRPDDFVPTRLEV